MEAQEMVSVACRVQCVWFMSLSMLHECSCRAKRAHLAHEM